MAIIINIDVMLAKRKMSVTELTEKVGITMANLSILKNGKAKAVRLVPSGETLEFSQDGAAVAFVVPSVTGHQMVEIAY